MDKKPIPLSRPIEAHGEKISSLTFSEPDLGMLEGIHITVTGEGEVKLNLGDLPKVVSRLANIPPSAASKISLVDSPKLLEAVKGFFGEFLATGE